MNRSMIIGRLTRDPELRMTGSGISVCAFTVAVDRRFDKEKKADFFNCVSWRGLAESVGNNLQKGSKVFVSGSLQNREYVAKDGTKRYVTEIVADEVEFLSLKHSDNGDDKHYTEPQYEAVDDEDLPF